nr:hypothetical protein [Mycolicibacterium sp.]
MFLTGGEPKHPLVGRPLIGGRTTVRGHHAGGVDQFQEVDPNVGDVSIAFGQESLGVFVIAVSVERVAVPIQLVEDPVAGTALHRVAGEEQRTGLVFANGRNQFASAVVKEVFVTRFEDEPHDKTESATHGFLLVVADVVAADVVVAVTVSVAVPR